MYADKISSKHQAAAIAYCPPILLHLRSDWGVHRTENLVPVHFIQAVPLVKAVQVCINWSKDEHHKLSCLTDAEKERVPNKLCMDTSELLFAHDKLCQTKTTERNLSKKLDSKRGLKQAQERKVSLLLK